jgi:hypothetical protein
MTHFCLNSLISTVGFLALCNVVLAACPENNSDRVNYQNNQVRRVVETSDGRKYSCWWDRTAQPITFQNIIYDVAIKCSETLTIYTHLDSNDEAVVENNGGRSLYQAEYLGDRYECDQRGQTMIKSWRYRNGVEVINQTDYFYYPYKW